VLPVRWIDPVLPVSVALLAIVNKCARALASCTT
jgi:hypothetical protein